MTELQKRLRAARAYAGLSHDELATATEMGRSTIIRNEHGQRVPKTMELREIARVCDLPLEFFTGDFTQMKEAG